MTDVWLYVLVCLLAVHGILALGAVFMKVRSREKQWNRGGFRLVLVTRNREDAIEGIVRSLYMGGLIRRVFPEEGIMVVDMNSTDSTKEILIRLKREYGSPDVLAYDEREKVFFGLEPEEGKDRR